MYTREAGNHIVDMFTIYLHILEIKNQLPNKQEDCTSLYSKFTFYQNIDKHTTRIYFTVQKQNKDSLTLHEEVNPIV